MKSLYKLQVPPQATNSLLLNDIAVPMSPLGLEMAEWWKTASLSDRVEVVNTGAATGNFLEAWQKVAGDRAEEVTDKSRHDLKSAIRAAEQTNNALNDTSNMSEPSTINP